MKKGENLKKNKLEKPDKNHINKKQDLDLNNKLSDERLKKKLETDSIKNSQNISKKIKKKLQIKKRKSIEMYLVLFIFLVISTICLCISHFALESETKEILDKNKKISLAVFILMLIGSFVFSLIVSCCECLIKSHFLGVIFFICLNLSIDYCVVYISYLSFFEPIFCFLIMLVSGSLGCLLITIFVKDPLPKIYILLLFNLLFSIIGGLILFFIYNKLWDIIFSVFALIISEFNVYSSQYKICSKDVKDPMTYSQPFEIIISFFKMLFFLFNIIKKLVLFFSKLCKCKKKEDEEDEKDEKGEEAKDNENEPNDDVEEGADDNEEKVDNDEQNEK